MLCSSKVVASSIRYQIVNRERPGNKPRNEIGFILDPAYGYMSTYESTSYSSAPAAA